MDWRKSTYSEGNGGSCVEVASAGGVTIRDTTDRGGVTLNVPADAWQRFLDTLMWPKSHGLAQVEHSGASGGQCVEMALADCEH
jgi:hypothetical protein